MKILLIWPKGNNIKDVIPLSLGYLKSNLDNKKHEIKIFDCSLNNVSANSQKLKEFIYDFAPDVIGISCWSPMYEEAVKLFNVIKEINSKIITVIGGAHFTAYPESVMQNGAIDFGFMGEAELSFQIFLEEIKNTNPDWSKIKGLVYRDLQGNIIKNVQERITDLDKINIPDYEAINLEKYRKKGYRLTTKSKWSAPIWTTRGCPYGCTFCSAEILNGKAVRKHSVDYVIKWIEYLYKNGTHFINIVDDNFTFDTDNAKEVCRRIIALNLKDLNFGTPNGIRSERCDEELLTLMKRSGWRCVVVAPESGSYKTLERMGKKLNLGAIESKIKLIKQTKLKVHGLFIIGFPGETEEDVYATRNFIRKCKFNLAYIGNFQPLPGTPIYNDLVANDEIVPGHLPKGYSDGLRSYTPAELKHFNFSKFILKEYLYSAITNPLNIPYMLSNFSPMMFIKKFFYNFVSMFRES